MQISKRRRAQPQPRREKDKPPASDLHFLPSRGLCAHSWLRWGVFPLHPGLGWWVLATPALSNRCKVNRCKINRCKINRCKINRCKINRCKINRCKINRCKMHRCKCTSTSYPEEVAEGLPQDRKYLLVAAPLGDYS